MSFVDLSGKTVIKVQLGNDIRKMMIHNDDLTYDELVLMVLRVYRNKLSSGNDLTIKYRDEDNDLVTIFDSADIAFAMQTCNRVLKLVVFVRDEALPLEDDEVRHVKKELQLIRDRVNRLLDTLEPRYRCPTDNTTETGSGSESESEDDHKPRQSSAAAVVANSAASKEFDPLARQRVPDAAATAVAATSAAASATQAKQEQLQQQQQHAVAAAFGLSAGAATAGRTSTPDSLSGARTPLAFEAYNGAQSSGSPAPAQSRQLQGASFTPASTNAYGQQQQVPPVGGYDQTAASPYQQQQQLQGGVAPAALGQQQVPGGQQRPLASAIGPPSQQPQLQQFIPGAQGNTGSQQHQAAQPSMPPGATGTPQAGWPAAAAAAAASAGWTGQQQQQQAWSGVQPQPQAPQQQQAGAQAWHGAAVGDPSAQAAPGAMAGTANQPVRYGAPSAYGQAGSPGQYYLPAQQQQQPQMAYQAASAAQQQQLPQQQLPQQQLPQQQLPQQQLPQQQLPQQQQQQQQQQLPQQQSLGPNPYSRGTPFSQHARPAYPQTPGYQ